MIEEDFGSLYSTDIFGTPAEHIPIIGPPQTDIVGIFDLPFIDLSLGVESLNVTFEAPVISFTTFPKRNDVMIILAINYLVITAEFDRTGKVVMIQLKRS